jgi:hypothetical protein
MKMYEDATPLDMDGRRRTGCCLAASHAIVD